MRRAAEPTAEPLIAPTAAPMSPPARAPDRCAGARPAAEADGGPEHRREDTEAAEAALRTEMRTLYDSICPQVKADLIADWISDVWSRCGIMPCPNVRVSSPSRPLSTAGTRYTHVPKGATRPTGRTRGGSDD